MSNRKDFDYLKLNLMILARRLQREALDCNRADLHEEASEILLRATHVDSEGDLMALAHYAAQAERVLFLPVVH